MSNITRKQSEKGLKTAQIACNNQLVVDVFLAAFIELNNNSYKSKKRLYHCEAFVYETEHYYFLKSYETFIAIINKSNDCLYDGLRGIYGYAHTSAYHLRNFALWYYEIAAHREVLNNIVYRPIDGSGFCVFMFEENSTKYSQISRFTSLNNEVELSYKIGKYTATATVKIYPLKPDENGNYDYEFLYYENSGCPTYIPLKDVIMVSDIMLNYYRNYPSVWRS